MSPEQLGSYKVCTETNRSSCPILDVTLRAVEGNLAHQLVVVADEVEMGVDLPILHHKPDDRQMHRLCDDHDVRDAAQAFEVREAVSEDLLGRNVVTLGPKGADQVVCGLVNRVEVGLDLPLSGDETACPPLNLQSNVANGFVTGPCSVRCLLPEGTSNDSCYHNGSNR